MLLFLFYREIENLKIQLLKKDSLEKVFNRIQVIINLSINSYSVSIRGRRQMNRLNSAKMNRLNFGYLAELAEFKKNI